MKPPFVRSAYNYDMDEASDESGLKCMDKSLTQQEFREESDINFIADRYGLTGEMPQVVNSTLAYGDFTGVFDFQTAQNAVIAARDKFMQLPARMRARFDNDPAKLLKFLDDPENRKEAIAIGLLEEPPTATAAPDDLPGEPLPPARRPEASQKAQKGKSKGSDTPSQNPDPDTE